MFRRLDFLYEQSNSRVEPLKEGDTTGRSLVVRVWGKREEGHSQRQGLGSDLGLRSWCSGLKKQQAVWMRVDRGQRFSRLILVLKILRVERRPMAGLVNSQVLDQRSNSLYLLGLL